MGQSDTFTATVTPNSLDPSTNGPTGTVQFLDGATVIDTETLPATGAVHGHLHGLDTGCGIAQHLGGLCSGQRTSSREQFGDCSDVVH